MSPRPSTRAVARALAAAFLLLWGVLAATPAWAAFTPPALDGHVVDTAGKLTADEVHALDAKLESFRRDTGFEIVAFLAGSLEGETIDDVAYTTFNTWKLGQKGADNGVLLVVAPAERKMRIETGKGVGGAITDLQASDILAKSVGPLLKQDRFYDALDAGTQGIERALGADAATGAAPVRPRAPDAAPGGVSLLRGGLAAGLLLLVLVLAIVSPGFRQFLFFMLLFGRGGRGGGGWGGGGGGWGGGGGGSGFGGGGGSSGGGGASGGY